jgi:hypothetical protein
MGSIRRRGAVLVLAAAIVAVAAALAVAAGNGPKTDATQATFTAQLTDQKARTCTGQDGNYVSTRERYAGTITGDPRISGKLLVKSQALVNTDTGLGTSRGTVRILDPATGRTKAHGKFKAVVTEGSVLTGFLDGHVRSQGGDTPRRDARLWANFRAQGDAQGAVTGELGGGTSEDTAVIQSGKCGSPKQPKPKKAKKQHKARH